MKILVVGSGPAGAISSYLLASYGHKVQLVERKPEPEKPVICGEFFPTKELAAEFVPPGEELELSYKFLRDKHIMVKHDGVVLEFEGVRKKVKTPLYIISRYLFVNEIVKASVNEGTQLLTKTSFVGGREKNGKFKTKLVRNGKEIFEEFDYVIGADAYPSTVAKSFGLPYRLRDEDIALTITVRMVDVDYKKGTVYLLFSPEIAPGAYAWIFPSKDFYNVGVGILKNYKDQPMQRYLDNFISKGEYFSSAEIITDKLGKPLPVGGMNRQPGKKGVILVGDAAWLVVPTNGGGINNALISGVLAAKAIDRNPETAHIEYKEKLWHYVGRLLDQSLKYRYKVDRMFQRWGLFKNLAKIAPVKWIWDIILGKKTKPGNLLLKLPI